MVESVCDDAQNHRLSQIPVVDHVLSLVTASRDAYRLPGKRIFDEHALSRQMIGGTRPAEFPRPIIRRETERYELEPILALVIDPHAFTRQLPHVVNRVRIRSVVLCHQFVVGMSFGRLDLSVDTSRAHVNHPLYAGDPRSLKHLHRSKRVDAKATECSR